MNQDLKVLISNAVNDDDINISVEISVAVHDYIISLDGIEASKYISTTLQGKLELDLSNYLKDTTLESFNQRDDIFLRHHNFDYCILKDGVVEFDADNIIKDYLYKDNDFVESFIEEWRTSPTVKRVVITHDKCFDGLGVALVASNAVASPYINNLYGVFVKYNEYSIDDILEQIEDALVFIGDFSFSLEELNKLKEKARKVVLVDHHDKSFLTATEEHTNCIYDTSKSGAVLAHEFFSPYGMNDIPQLIELIGDRDVWNWYHGDMTKATSMLLSGYIGDMMGLINEISIYARQSVSIRELLQPYLSVVKHNEEQINQIVNDYSLEMVMLGSRENKFLSINVEGRNNKNVSDILNRLSSRFKMPAMGYSISQDVMYVSLRSTSEEVDVNKIAMLFNGGGHKAASGFKVNLTEEILKDFFINKMIRPSNEKDK